MNYQLIGKIGLIKSFANWIWMVDAKNKFRQIERFLPKNDKLLDFGSGLGTVSKLLKEKGFHVVPLDIANHSFYETTTPVIYDGVQTNYDGDSFDQVLVLTVLHHIENQEQILNEAMRIGKQIVIIEDIYRNKIQKQLTYFFDSLVNLEFKDHPHSNRSMEEWKRLFVKLNLELTHVHDYSYMLFFRQAVFVLQKRDL